MIIISAHADTNFKNVKLTVEDEYYKGYLDNYVGVFAVMKAYFSGEINFDYVRVELTYGEETDMEGAKQVSKNVKVDDLVIVVDVTATPTDTDFVIEKCKSDKVRKFLEDTLTDFRFDLYKGCPDPVSNMDEVDIYKRKTDNYFFLGLPCSGGDYNLDVVQCKIRSVDEAARSLIKICNDYENFNI
ncbi:MAG: hypothetical protein ABI840_08885 [bacterium]